MRFASKGFRLFAVGAALAIVAIYVVHSSLITASEDAVERSARYDVAWVGAGGRLEAAKLQIALATYISTRDPEAAGQVALFTEILVNRFSIYEAPAFRAFLAAKTGREWVLDRARAEFLQARPSLLDVEILDEGDLATLTKQLASILSAVDRVGAEAHTESVEAAELYRQEVRRQQRFQRWLTTGLFVLIATVLGVVALQNRFLGRAHREASRNAADFAYLARHDALTGLPNRMAFNETLHRLVIELSLQPERRLAILAIDLDGFKGINDSLGHAIGDRLLKTVAQRLSERTATFSNTLIAARLGGDEFVIIFDATVGENEILSQAERLLADVSRPYRTSGTTLTLGATIGVALSSPGSDAEGLLVDADLALSLAKSRNKGTVLLFDPNIRDAYERRSLLESDMRDALVAGDIRPNYQPKVDILTGQVTGVEALARWSHPTLGMVSPCEFIPIAESSPLIIDLGRTILETACRDALNLPEEIGISVNLSVNQFLRDDIVETVRSTLQATGLSPRRLTLEVTESLMISDAGGAVNTLGRLKALGVSISLDDFGTGYSALSYLRSFDWDEIKIDRSFVMELETDRRARAIVRSIASLADELGIHVTAEGAETDGQIDVLSRAGCRTGQGYFYGKPMPAEELGAAVLNRFVAGRQTAAEPGKPQIAS
jgi:diguanylate cyclase (GGDEF)-like protein